MYNDKIYKYSIRDTTELLADESNGSVDPINDDIAEAQVTITADCPIMVLVPIVDEGSFVQNTPAIIPGVILGQSNTETRTVTVPLYKGVCALTYKYLAGYHDEISLTVSGNATTQTYNYTHFAFITGDCTVNLLHNSADPIEDTPAT